ncbi:MULTISPECIES: LLM class flavin-dependent oxidoreductase [Shouchella]|uniref:LLM class flavin-dependent oxidoreductase n=2 Tax=Shouchella TaxID=2893057 RepID=A0ABY7VZD0_9BACI|nr:MULTISPECIES: LLM class flavin-dependent oxidoreductase [Shouchella]MED4128817.1 LLM class flavin-dependent oxidoreductase [Shouchella miscanthi]WDF01954.1 LLM class flavin-dependent oxidoreductase [Shouchella hunanensis]
MANRHMHLGAFLMTPGHHVAAWRHEDSANDAKEWLSADYYVRLAQLAEKGLFDMVFFADHYADRTKREEDVSHSVTARLDPILLLSAMTHGTSRIGLCATASTSFYEPYYLARAFGTIDHLSHGRAAWNVVTSGNAYEALNFSRDAHYDHALRYERATESLKVAKKLWASWEEDAIVLDKKAGRFTDSSKVRTIDHEGHFFSVPGPLNIPRPVQGHPVIVQAGSSEPGKELAASSAEVIFTAWKTRKDAEVFYRDVKQRLVKYGRDANDLKVMPGVMPIIGKTEEEAKEKAAHFRSLIPEEAGLRLLSGLLNFDLTGYPLDGPLPDLPPVETNNGAKTRFELVTKLAKVENLTIRQLYQHIAGARGHREIYGTPEQIADQLQDWFENGAADGFNIMAPLLPDGLEEFITEVIPILQERGLFRTNYEGRTLRDHLGLKKPNAAEVLQR